MPAAPSRKKPPAVATVETSLNIGLLKFDFEETLDEQANSAQPRSKGIREMIVRWLNEEL